jgi:hypothetical protein
LQVDAVFRLGLNGSQALTQAPLPTSNDAKKAS